MTTQCEPNIVEQQACCDDHAGFVQEKIRDTTEGLRRKEIDRGKRVRNRAFGCGRRFAFLLRCQPVLDIQQLLHEGQQRRDEADHGATEHEHVFAEIFGHEAVPF